MYLTPQLLRDAADYLVGDGERHSNPEARREFMCLAIGQVSGGAFALFSPSAMLPFERLLKRHGVPLGGRIMEPYDQSMSVRFMFLEFLALDMETRRASRSKTKKGE
jgi:hypothetical protein